MRVTFFSQSEFWDTDLTLFCCLWVISLSVSRRSSNVWVVKLLMQAETNVLCLCSRRILINCQIHQDMTHPVSEYYIYTGHNSYLTGNQLSSNSSDVPIVEALRRGVRVIELDLWPDPKDGGIKVTHGKYVIFIIRMPPS